MEEPKVVLINKDGKQIEFKHFVLYGIKSSGIHQAIFVTFQEMAAISKVLDIEVRKDWDNYLEDDKDGK